MGNSFRKVALGILTATAIWLCGYFFGVFGAHPPTKESDAATWAGAFGTFLALCGAIGLATFETRRRDREAMTSARLRVHAMYFRLEINEANLVATFNALKSIVDANEIDPITHPLGDAQVKIIEDSLADFLPWDDSELLPLSVLPGNVAIELAITQGRVLAVQKLLDSCRGELNVEKTLQSCADILGKSSNSISLIRIAFQEVIESEERKEFF